MSVAPAPARVASSDDIRRAAYERFQRETAIPFVKVARTSLHSVIHDPAAGAGPRVLAWVQLHSWGNYSAFAVRASGKPSTQLDCSDATGLNKATVSRAVADLAARGYVRVDGRKLVLIAAPSAIAQATPGRDWAAS
jgi:CRP-like cAMP-binding protein